jgi:hypothetical protein
MRNSVKVTQVALVTGFTLISTGIASVAEAQGNLNARLRGAYASAVTKTCVVSSLPFEGPNLAIPQVPPPPAPAPVITRNIQSNSGIITFNGDGTATAIGRYSNLTIAQATSVGSPVVNTPGFAPLALGDFSSDITYAVYPDDTVDTEQTTIAVSVFPVFPTPFTSKIIGTLGRLQISQDHKTLISAPQTEASVEPVFSPPTATTPANYRICINHVVLTKIRGD